MLPSQGEMGENTPFTRKCRKKECKRPRDQLTGHNSVQIIFLGEEFCKGLYCLALNKSCFIERRLSLFLLSMLLNNPIYFYFPVLFSCLTGHRIT